MSTYTAQEKRAIIWRSLQQAGDDMLKGLLACPADEYWQDLSGNQVRQNMVYGSACDQIEIKWDPKGTQGSQEWHISMHQLIRLSQAELSKAIVGPSFSLGFLIINGNYIITSRLPARRWVLLPVLYMAVHLQAAPSMFMRDSGVEWTHLQAHIIFQT
ncbi:hypothetical protein BDZ97DRAFT_1828729 [Flammula alnicola]|nr:hypothetical protein BDZ97DRAFT_1828729 [Flammula alnicola]